MQPQSQPATPPVPQPRGGFIFYPRFYSIGRGEQGSYADGSDASGRPCRVILAPPAHLVEAAKRNSSASVPDLAEFALTDNRAKNPCIATATNCPTDRAGVLLIEQAYVIDREKRTFGGRWASVLARDASSPAPQYGMGYLEIGRIPKLSDEARALALDRARMIEDLRDGRVADRIDTQARIDEIYFDLLAAQRHYFIAVLMHCNEMKTLDTKTPSALWDAVKPHLVERTVSGRYAGVLIRVRKGDLVLRGKCASIDMQYDYKNRVPYTVDQVWEQFNRFMSQRVFSTVKMDPAIEIDVIPTTRINCGKSTNERYSKELLRRSGEKSKLINTYVEKALRDDPLCNIKASFGFLASKFAVRMHDIWRGPDAGNLIASACHAYSPSVGNALSLNQSMESAYEVR